MDVSRPGASPDLRASRGRARRWCCDAPVGRKNEEPIRRAPRLVPCGFARGAFAGEVSVITLFP